ncbi:MarR family EPS-associated transcriptional regulator [Ideonella margarita]|uniref:MarR family EPS-associated transcriptional regulator n=1 Tax=Ideonella margarita TaxID=2984191 RepID=A0ABU9C255_9BURK
MIERTPLPVPVPPSGSGADGGVDDASKLALLRFLTDQHQLSQRQLSQALGLSLGKTHYVLHALLDRGLIKARNFRRSDNKLAYAYFLTPAGVSEKLRIARRFLALKESEYEALQCLIQELRADIATQEGCAERGA